MPRFVSRRLVPILAGFALILALTPAPARAADTIDVVVDAFAVGGQLFGVSLGQTERALVKDLLRCTAVDGKPLIGCTRDVLANPLLSQLPADLRPVAKCLIDGKSPQTCATDQVLNRLPPEARGLAQCISRGQDIGACGRQFAMQGDLKRAFDAITGLDVDRAARNPMLQADRTVQNIICTIQAVDKEDWVDVVRCGGTEIAKKVVKTILAAVASPALVGVLSPVIDAMIQDRVDFVAEVVKAAKAGDEGTLAELAVEAYILTGTPLAGVTAICQLLPDGAVKEFTCGAIGDAVRWVAGAGGDIVEGIGDGAEDVALALGGNQCKAPPNFYRDTITGCLPWGASTVIEGALQPGSQASADLYPGLENEIYAQCRRNVQGWYERGVFGTTSTSECANAVCDPLRARFGDQAYTVGQAVLDTAFAFARAARYEAERVTVGANTYQCQQWGAESRFVTDCITALRRQFPYLEGENGALRCTIHGTQVKSSAPFYRICQAELDRVGKKRIRSCGCPEGLYKRSSSSEAFTCSHTVTNMVGMFPGLPVTREDPGRGSHTVPHLGPSPFCPSGWSGVYPNCCEPGTVSMGGACVQRQMPLPPRVASPPIVPAKPTACPPGWGGDYPNCCEPGAVFMGGACVQRRTTLPPRVASPPTVPSPPKVCPMGTRLSGAGCVSIERRVCTGGRIGMPPACYCPQGQRWTGARCIVIAMPRPPQAQTPQRPRPTRTCPPGRYLIAGYCRPFSSRQPKPGRPPIDYGGRPRPSGTLIK